MIEEKMVEEKLIGQASSESKEGALNPSSQAIALGRLLMLALEAESGLEQAAHLEAVQELLQKLDPVQRRNVQQILESLGSKLWTQTKPMSEGQRFPALSIECDHYGDMTAITCRFPGPRQPDGKTIKLKLRKANPALLEGRNLFRLETGEPIIIRFSDKADCKMIREIVSPFGCNRVLGTP